MLRKAFDDRVGGGHRLGALQRCPVRRACRPESPSPRRARAARRRPERRGWRRPPGPRSPPRRRLPRSPPPGPPPRCPCRGARAGRLAGAAIVIADDAVVARQLGGDRVVTPRDERWHRGPGPPAAPRPAPPSGSRCLVRAKPTPRARFSQVRPGNGCRERRVQPRRKQMSETATSADIMAEENADKRRPDRRPARDRLLDGDRDGDELHRQLREPRRRAGAGDQGVAGAGHHRGAGPRPAVRASGSRSSTESSPARRSSAPSSPTCSRPSIRPTSCT